MAPTCIGDPGASHANCIRSVALARSIVGRSQRGALRQDSDCTGTGFVEFIITITLHPESRI
jgi:hypothetical protein